MSYRIPDEGRVAEAVFAVMYRNQQVRSQREMADLVRRELDRDGEGYRISGERIRRIAVNRGLLQLVIEYSGADGGEPPDVCPVCRNRMSPVMNATLDGGEVEVGRRCTACPYAADSARRVPGRYTFVRGARRGDGRRRA